MTSHNRSCAASTSLAAITSGAVLLHRPIRVRERDFDDIPRLKDTIGAPVGLGRPLIEGSEESLIGSRFALVRITWSPSIR
jgi:hypothetical protein